jgi:glycosyltransferase involved in cell wall biosynthesis
MPRVLMIQAQMKHYRIPFFTRLFETLRRDGIDLRVAYSPPHGVHGMVRDDGGDLPSEFGRRVPGQWIAGRVIYQPLWREIAAADLVITGHENKYLMNSWLFLLSALHLKTVALWGLGPCMEEDQSRLSHWLREKALGMADWYFGYTDGVVPYLRRHGVSAERITSVQNAVDTGELRRSVENISEDEVGQAKSKLGIATGPVGVYCGILEPTKHVPFLVAAARLVRQQIPDFQLLIVGSGPDRAWVEEEARSNRWIHYLGQKFGREKALALRMADIFVLPGRVGLAILDSFAAGLPLFTTDLTIHGPEVSYLTDGENGRKTAHDLQAYADALVDAIRSPDLLEEMRRRALATASKYTIEAMAENFRVGIKQCLALRSSTPRMAPALSE